MKKYWAVDHTDGQVYEDPTIEGLLEDLRLDDVDLDNTTFLCGEELEYIPPSNNATLVLKAS